MKRLYTNNLNRAIKLSMMVLLVAGTHITAQAQKVVNVSLSNPGKPGKLKMTTTFGAIKIVGYNGKEVKISSSSVLPKKSHSDKSGGLKRIANSFMKLTITEENNYVKISTSSHQHITYLIQVPRKFDLKLGMVNGGKMEIENIEGEIEASNVNGSIIAKNISGAMLANTVNGKIIVDFDKIKPNTPMSFRGLSGKIDLTLPKSTKATFKMRADRGDIFSDFEMDIVDEPTVVKKGDNKKRIIVSKWVKGKLNGGGANFTLKNMHGNIYIRQKK